MKHAIYNAQKYTKVIEMGWIPWRISADGQGGGDFFFLLTTPLPADL